MPNVLPMFNNLNVYSNFHHSALDICKLNSTFETLLPTTGMISVRQWGMAATSAQIP